MRHAAVLALSLAASAAAAQTISPPTIIERLQDKAAKNPALLKQYTELPPALKDARWLAGSWNLTHKTFATQRSPEKVERGTREASFQLEGRWLVCRDTYPDREGVQIFGYEPIHRQWMFTYFSSEGRGTNRPLLADSGWDSGRLILSGTFYIAGEQANVNLRLSRISDDEYLEVWEEVLAMNVTRPVIEIHAERKKGAAPTKPAGSDAPSKDEKPRE